MRKLIVFVLLSIVSTSALADEAVEAGTRLQPTSVNALQQALPERLQKALNQLAQASGFGCRFEQKIYYQDGGRQQYEGTLEIAKPDKFRWQYLKPYEQLYVSNGDGIWFYEPDLMQAQKMQSLDSVDPVMMQFLNGKLKNSDIHLLTDDGLPGIYHVRLSDGPELWVSVNDNGNPAWLESEDALGNRNRMTLIDMHFGELDRDRFDFTPPAGVDVVEFSDKEIFGDN